MQWLKDNNTNTFNDRRLFIVSLIISAALLFVCSKNSLIYPMNDYCDINDFFSITDSMFHGLVLYRDIFEHKGPFLFVVYGLIHILGNSYFTLYLFECIANALFVYFGTKTILLYDKDAGRIRTFLYALCLEFCLCTSTTFMFGGTVEELYLWMSMYGLYVTLRCLKNEQYYSNRELVITGLLCGMLFWTKYALLGFYTGLAIYVVVWNIAQKNLTRLGKTILLFLGGFAISCVPTVIYCAITHSFGDMAHVYFVGNIFGKHGESSYMAHFYALMNIIYKDIAVFLFIVSGAVYLLKSERTNIKLFFATCFITAFIASCCLKVFWTYYPMPMQVFIPFGIIALKNMKTSFTNKVIITVLLVIIHMFVSVEFGLISPLLGDKINPVWLKEHIRVLVNVFIPLLLLYFSYSCTNEVKLNTVRRLFFCVCTLSVCAILGYGIRDPFFFTEQQQPQIRFSEKIKQTDNANILIFGTYDFGFNKNSNTYPKIKYFCNMDLAEDDTESEQLGYIKNEIIDYIVTLIKPDEFDEVIGTSYKLIDIAESYYYNGYTMRFYLYKK